MRLGEGLVAVAAIAAAISVVFNLVLLAAKLVIEKRLGRVLKYCFCRCWAVRPYDHIHVDNRPISSSEIQQIYNPDMWRGGRFFFQWQQLPPGYEWGFSMCSIPTFVNLPDMNGADENA